MCSGFWAGRCGSGVRIGVRFLVMVLPLLICVLVLFGFLFGCSGFLFGFCARVSGPASSTLFGLQGWSA